MTNTISVRFDKEIQRDLSKIEKKLATDRSEVIRRLIISAIKKWKIDNSISEIREHKISIGKAAEECGVNLLEMIDILKENNVDWIGYGEEDLKRDLAILE